MKVEELLTKLGQEVCELDNLIGMSYKERPKLPKVLKRMQKQIKKVREDALSMLDRYERSLTVCKQDVNEMTGWIRAGMESLDSTEKILEYENWKDVDNKFKKLEEIEKEQPEIQKEIANILEAKSYEQRSSYFKEFFSTVTKKVDSLMREIIEGRLENYRSNLPNIRKIVDDAKTVYEIETNLVVEKRTGGEVYGKCVDSVLEEIKDILLDQRIPEEKRMSIIQKIARHIPLKFTFLKEEKLPLTSNGEILPILPQPFYAIADSLERMKFPPEYGHLLDRIKRDMKKVERRVGDGTIGVAVLTNDKVKKVIKLYQNYESRLITSDSIRHDDGHYTFLGRFLYGIPVGLMTDYSAEKGSIFSQKQQPTDTTISANEINKKFVLPITEATSEVEKAEGVDKLMLFKNVLELYREVMKNSCPKKLVRSDITNERYQYFKGEGRSVKHSGFYISVVDFLDYVVNSGIISVLYDDKKSKNVLKREGIRDSVSVEFLKGVCEILAD